jgi:hypothetical protein
VKALWWFWVHRGYVGEGRKWLDLALGSDDGNPETRSKALYGAGFLA